jgi:hypothetical protein
MAAPPKLNIADVMLALDKKDRAYYDKLSEDDKKGFSPFMMIRWGSSVGGIPDLQGYYLVCANERYNKNFFDVSSSKHPKLHWLTATTISPGMGKQFHPWIAGPKKESTNKVESFFVEQFPSMKLEDIRLLIATNSAEDIKAYMKSLGKEDKDIKALVK